MSRRLTPISAVAKEYPDATIRATDIGVPPPQHVPRNYVSYFDDANKPWTWSSGSLHLVHCRGLLGCVNWEDLINQAEKSLAPGGFLEICDMTLPKTSDIPAGLGEGWHRLVSAIEMLGNNKGRPFDIDAAYCRSLMNASGFEIVVDETQNWYLAPNTDPYADILLALVMERLEALAPFVFHLVMALPEEQAESGARRFCESIRKRLRQGAGKPYVQR